MRTIRNGTRWLLRTGAPWRDLPERSGSWPTGSSRFYRWQQAGVWNRVLAALQEQAAAAGRVDWDIHFVDSSLIRVPQHAVGAKGDPATEARGRSQGGVSTNLQIRVDGQGPPVVFVLPPDARHASTAFDADLAGGRVQRPGRGQPKQRPQRVGGDKAYSHQHIRSTLRRHKIGSGIPPPHNQRRRGPFNKALYGQRNQVERCFNRLKQNRRVAMRYETRASMYGAVVTVAAIMLWYSPLFADTPCTHEVRLRKGGQGAVPESESLDTGPQRFAGVEAAPHGRPSSSNAVLRDRLLPHCADGLPLPLAHYLSATARLGRNPSNHYCPTTGDYQAAYDAARWRARIVAAVSPCIAGRIRCGTCR